MNLIVCIRSSLGPQQWGQQRHTSKQSTQWSTIPNVSLLFNSSEHSDLILCPGRMTSTAHWASQTTNHSSQLTLSMLMQQNVLHTVRFPCVVGQLLLLFLLLHLSAEQIQVHWRIEDCTQNKQGLLHCTTKYSPPPNPHLWVPSDTVSHSVIVSNTYMPVLLALGLAICLVAIRSGVQKII